MDLNTLQRCIKMFFLKRQQVLQIGMWLSPVLLNYWHFISLIRGLMLYNDYCASQSHMFCMNRFRVSQLQCYNSGFDLSWTNYHWTNSTKFVLVWFFQPFFRSCCLDTICREEMRKELNAKCFMRWIGLVLLLFTPIKPKFLLLQTAGIATSSLRILKNTSGNLL